MRKQVGRIYCRDVSKSPQKITQPIQRSQLQDPRTMRKDRSYAPYIIITQPNKTRLSQQTYRNKDSKFNSVTSEASKQFSSIHESSVLSAQEQSLYLKESKMSKRSEQRNLFETSMHNESYFADSLAVYENPVMKNNQIVKKLSHLNNIFKEIKNLRVEKLSRHIIGQINETERDLIEVERNILRTC